MLTKRSCCEIKMPRLMTRHFCVTGNKLHSEGVANAIEGIADLRAKDAHNGNHNDRDESKNNRIFDEALAFFLE